MNRIVAAWRSSVASWRTVDIIVTAVIGVVFGVVFFVWNNAVWPALTPLGPFANLFYGPWLIPAVLTPLIIRKPGSGIIAELVAASISVLLVDQWGPVILLYGLVAAWALDWAIYYQGVAVNTQIEVGVLMIISGLVIVAAGSLYLARALRRAGVLRSFEGSTASRW